MSKPPDYSALRLWFDVGQFIGTLVVAAYVWVSNRTQANAKEVDGVKKIAQKLETRVTKLETGMAHVLSHEDLGAVYERINEVAGGVSELSGKMDAVQGSLSMIHEHLLNKSGGTQ
ncbi:hypothetical protein DSLASN_02340 [Desulfoluna limicola]|uniref:DUF2730 family protein n=1 Tax=Desulfoluna limicola TaxID=2810562 RepID=A0ABM7PC01_9BACT|nr:DUF2730 family protein [Desulfoluna limicola]BCS94602.1 hypothetical protein DSLASN_02340 [Desulfoluna limicola]